jgi:RNA polymerase sigma-70 factor (ECF subfamily)
MQDTTTLDPRLAISESQSAHGTSRADGAIVDAGSDDHFVELVRTNPATFRILYERHMPAVYRYLRSRTGRDEEAADLAALTFERALAGLSGYRPTSGGFKAWLLRIARNAAIDAARRRRTTESIETARDIETAEPGPESRLIDAERTRELRRIVAGLPEIQRDAVVLRYASGLAAREIALVFGKSEAATQKLLTRALARLKESFSEYE